MSKVSSGVYTTSNIYSTGLTGGLLDVQSYYCTNRESNVQSWCSPTRFNCGHGFISSYTTVFADHPSKETTDFNGP